MLAAREIEGGLRFVGRIEPQGQRGRQFGSQRIEICGGALFQLQLHRVKLGAPIAGLKMSLIECGLDRGCAARDHPGSTADTCFELQLQRAALQ